MTQKNETSKTTIEKPFPKDGEFINFEIRQEGWNLYRIKDGTLLRGRLVLSGVMVKGKLDEIIKQFKPGQKLKLGLVFNPRTVFAAESPPELRGKPDSRSYTAAELKLSIIDEDMDFETEREVWNLYELENGITLKMRLSVVSINKTDKFESAGMPLYTVNSNIDVKFELPEQMRKTVEEKSRVE